MSGIPPFPTLALCHSFLYSSYPYNFTRAPFLIFLDPTPYIFTLPYVPMSLCPLVLYPAVFLYNMIKAKKTSVTPFPVPPHIMCHSHESRQILQSMTLSYSQQVTLYFATHSSPHHSTIHLNTLVLMYLMIPNTYPTKCLQ